PEDLACLGLQTADGSRAPDDEVAAPADVIDHRRGVAGRALEGTPQFLAGVLVKGDRHALVAADHADEPVAAQQRMRREAPHLHRRAVFLAQVLAPQRLAVARVEAKQVAHRAERVKPAVAHQRCRARPGWVAHLVTALVLVLPEDLPGVFLQAEDTLFALG